MSAAEHPPSRRAFLRLAGAAGAAAAAGTLAGCSAAEGGPHPARGGQPLAAPTSPLAAVPAYGVHQAGVARPLPPQPHVLVGVFDVATPAVARLLAGLGRRIEQLVTTESPVGLAPGNLTVTVGVGPRLARASDPTLPGADELPAFPRERMTAEQRGGDLLLQLCASDPMVLPAALQALVSSCDGHLRQRWTQAGTRGAYQNLGHGIIAPRNLLGFVDGIVGPAGNLDAAPEVWIGSGAARHGSVAVVRRMELDMAAFAGLSVADQEAAVGRRRDDSAPLSGGAAADAPDLGAKTPDGRYVLPARSHIRRAHAGATGVPLMLRRSYSITDPGGLLFISFQTQLRTFAATMARMSTGDALFDLSTTTASGSFLILPGYDEHQPLGSTLFR